jgi:hypothetical protein
VYHQSATLGEESRTLPALEESRTLPALHQMTTTASRSRDSLTIICCVRSSTIYVACRVLRLGFGVQGLGVAPSVTKESLSTLICPMVSVTIPVSFQTSVLPPCSSAATQWATT